MPTYADPIRECTACTAAKQCSDQWLRAKSAIAASAGSPRRVFTGRGNFGLALYSVNLETEPLSQTTTLKREPLIESSVGCHGFPPNSSSGSSLAHPKFFLNNACQNECSCCNCDGVLSLRIAKPVRLHFERVSQESCWGEHFWSALAERRQSRCRFGRRISIGLHIATF